MSRNEGVFVNGFFYLGCEGAKLSGKSIVMIDFSGNLCHIRKNHRSKHIGRKQISVGAGIITWTETGPDQAGTAFDESTFAVSGQGIRIDAVMTLESVRGFFFMILLRVKQIENRMGG